MNLLFLKTSSSYPPRLELFRVIVRINGFRYKFQTTPKDVFKELSKMRYLHPSNVLPMMRHYSYSSPIARAPPFPIFPNKEIQLIPEIVASHFGPDGPLNNFRPHPYFRAADLKDKIMRNTINSGPLTLLSEY